MGICLFVCFIFSKSFAGADIDSFPLVVEISTVVDVLIIRVYEVYPSPLVIVSEFLNIFHEGNGGMLSFV